VCVCAKYGCVGAGRAQLLAPGVCARDGCVEMGVWVRGCVGGCWQGSASCTKCVCVWCARDGYVDLRTPYVRVYMCKGVDVVI
jgi:hypothetical protein